MTTTKLKIVGVRGGNRHPIAVRDFILGHLNIVGEDYPAEIHRAYKAALDQRAISQGRRHAYHKPVYQTFARVVNKMAHEGILEFTGREEESDNPMFAGMEWKPIRRYYRIATGAPSLDGHRDGHREGLLERGRTNGRGQSKSLSQDGDGLGERR